MVFPSSIPIGHPAHMEHNSSGIWFGHSNGVWLDEQEPFLNLALKKAVAYVQGGLASR